MSYVTTHVLDATAGRPAAGVAVTLVTIARRVDRRAGSPTPTAGWPSSVAGSSRATTEIDFATGDYFAGLGQQTFYPQVSICFSAPPTRATTTSRCC